ncbi:MAG TPA: META domain-containing protein [Usitatibacter sp.]|nr:META domain-containing protein [Usitatibacter sp.]
MISPTTARSALLALALAALLAACATQPREPPPKPFFGTRWEFLPQKAGSGEQPYVRFGDGRLEGFGGCGRFEARYIQDAVGAKAIAIGRIDRERRASCDRSTRDAEDHIIDVLQVVSGYTITADVMTMSGSGGMLLLRAAEEKKK